MKCERCGKELSDADLYCDRCGQAVFPEYMDEADVWAYYKSDEELEQILKGEKEGKSQEQKKQPEQALKKEETSAENSDEAAEKPESGKKGFWGRRKEKKETEAAAPEEKTEDGAVETDSNESSEKFIEPVTETENEAPENTEDMAEPEEPTVHTEVMTETPEVLEAETVETLPEKALLEESQAHSELESVAETVSNEEEEENFFAEEDDEEEDEEDEKEKRNLTPEGKKARRLRILLAVLFLLLCLTAGIFLSLRKMKEMEQQEKEYYQQLDSAANTENTKQKEASEENAQKASEEPAAAEDKKETKKEEYFKLVSAEDVDFSKYKKIQPTSTEENSVKQSDSYDYSAKSAIDGDTASSWQENEDGSGEGKGIKLTLDGNHKIRYIVLYLGNWRSDELWDYNSRPKELTIQVGETQKKDVKFSDEKKKFCLSFDEPVDASFVSLYIKSVYEGSRWQDTCISEIELYE